MPTSNIRESIEFSLKVSSIGGVSFVASGGKRSLFERCFWILMIMLMVSLATWHGLKVYNHYVERPSIVTMDKSYFDWKLRFPSMTVCMRALKMGTDLRNVVEKLVEKYGLTDEILRGEYENFTSYLRDLAFKSYADYGDYEPYATGRKEDYLQPEQYMETLDLVVASLKKYKSKPGHLPSMPINFPLNQPRMVRRIFTELGACMVANPDISIFYTPDYFNATKRYLDYKPIYYTSNMLASMTIKVELDGAIYVNFHGHNEVQDILDRVQVIPKGAFIQARYETDIVNTSDDVIDLSVKQRHCRLPYEPDVQPLHHSPVYSHNLCKFECRIEIALKRCHCTPYYYRRLAHEPICNLTGLYCLSAYKDELIHLNDNSTRCQSCPQNCDVSRYRVFDLPQQIDFVQTVYEASFIFPNKIYVRGLTFSKTDLLVQIGGVFGLFLGCSLLSIVEIIYSLTLRIFYGMRDRHEDRLD